MIELTVRLTNEQLAQIAERAADLLPGRLPAAVAPEPLLTVDELAEMLSVTSDWVRRHQGDLGAFRLSEGGGRNPIRFRASDVERFLAKRRLRPRHRVQAGGWRENEDWCLG
jgi:excisionase family DNA binding protein